jgi:hypothetical protein
MCVYEYDFIYIYIYAIPVIWPCGLRAAISDMVCVQPADLQLAQCLAENP